MLKDSNGFTLIELSIVIVIIGLIVGGVLAGRDLISAAQVRSQISQIEAYKTAVNTFKLKYGYLPGDIPEPAAFSFGFVGRGTKVGRGDGNGRIEGIETTASNVSDGVYQLGGETPIVWGDLAKAGLIEGDFTTASPNSVVAAGTITTADVGKYFPKAKLGDSNYINVWSASRRVTVPTVWYPANVNLFSIVAYQRNLFGWAETAPGLTVFQAYNIDRKVDDGLPQSGTVLALYNSSQGSWNGGTGWATGNASTLYAGAFDPDPTWVNYGAPTTDATPASQYTCYDNGGSVGTQQYSIGTNGGNGLNCALSFKMQ